MSDYDSDDAWTLESIRAALLDGRNARDAGGEDARLNKPIPQELYLPEFLRSITTRAEAKCHAVVGWHHDELAKLLALLRRNPYLLDPVSRRVEGTIQDVDTDIDQRIAHAAAEVAAKRNHAAETDKVYQRDLQAADASHPRGGWPDLLVLVLIAFGVLILEISASAWRLRHALGAPTALTTGAGLSIVALAGGGLCAFVMLRSTRRLERTRLGGSLRWLAAGAIGGLVLAVMYIGACYRDALIEGLNGNHADTLAKINSPGEVLLNNDVLSLLLLGIAGSCIAAAEVWTFYHGYRPLLRQSGVATERAISQLGELSNELKMHAARAASAGEATLNEIGRSYTEWVQSAAGYHDEAHGTETEARRRIDLVRRCVRVIAAEYVDGYHEVRQADRFAPMPDSMIGNEIDDLTAFTAIRADAVAEARSSAGALQRGHLEIARIVERAVIRIDEMAGLRAAHRPQRELLVTGQTP
jgi:hypothetical protein